MESNQAAVNVEGIAKKWAEFHGPIMRENTSTLEQCLVSAFLAGFQAYLAHLAHARMPPHIDQPDNGDILAAIEHLRERIDGKAPVMSVRGSLDEFQSVRDRLDKMDDHLAKVLGDMNRTIRGTSEDLTGIGRHLHAVGKVVDRIDYRLEPKDTPTDKPEVCNCQGEPVDESGASAGFGFADEYRQAVEKITAPMTANEVAMSKAISDMLIYGVGMVHISPKDVMKPNADRLFQALHGLGLDPFIYLTPSARHEYDYWLASRPNPVG